MSVRMIAISRPCIAEVPDTSALLAYCARVSSTANQLKHETGGRLLRSLIRRKEWSPLEMVSITVEIVTTRDIARQILRHRSFSFQEFSQRYSVVEAEAVLREARLQDKDDRQNSIRINNAPLQTWWRRAQQQIVDLSDDIYREALSLGIAKEVARAVLPEGITISKLYMAGTLRSWLHYLELRCDRKTQLEHRELALGIADLIGAELPDLADLLPGAVGYDVSPLATAAKRLMPFLSQLPSTALVPVEDFRRALAAELPEPEAAPLPLFDRAA